jgi:two-component system, cell cycle sensor histidine kinase and response regulator CckA
MCGLRDGSGRETETEIVRSPSRWWERALFVQPFLACGVMPPPGGCPAPKRRRRERSSPSEPDGNCKKDAVAFPPAVPQATQARTEFTQTSQAESLAVLAGGIAHDFNNIFMTVLGHADLALMEAMAQPDRDASILDHLREIVTATQRAASLSAQMLAYSGQGRFSVALEDLSALLREADFHLQTAVSDHTRVQCCLDEHLPAVEADRVQVRQAVLNLVRNADEAMSQGGAIVVSTGVLYCDQTYLEKCYRDGDLPDGRYAYVEVTDTGCGMDRATLSRVFDPFFSTKFTGRGLGLPAARGIMRGHHGAIEIRSAEGQGTTVRLLFPTL